MTEFVGNKITNYASVKVMLQGGNLGYYSTKALQIQGKKRKNQDDSVLGLTSIFVYRC